MAKGRKAKTVLPDCEFRLILIYTYMNKFSVVESSEDGKKVWCNICAALRIQTSNWIQKESLAYHLKSDVHACSVSAKHNKENIRVAGEQSMQEETAVEEVMDFVMLSSTIKPVVTVTARVPEPSVEEKEMWDNYSLSNEIFDAGIDHTVATVEERRRLEREATNFDIWRGADFLPEEDPNDGELLLDELEQDDILTELLRNARTCITFQLSSLMLIVFVIDVSAPEAADLLEEEARSHAGQPKTSDAWSPYESKTVSRLRRLFNVYI